MQKFLIRGNQAQEENEISQELILCQQLKLNISKDRRFKTTYRELRPKALAELGRNPTQRILVASVDVLYRKRMEAVNEEFGFNIGVIG